ncbi:MAG: dUTP diphosphatase [Oscillospiraceae bacterium]|nr:dUTP diphosphatase [Oscillospiraceae bacterium]MBR1897909.1 dUTP diphosphatase [Oscillospiraceae bacterium]
MKLLFEKIHPKAILPERKTAQSAGADLFACLDEPIMIYPGETAMVPIGVKCQPTRPDVALLIYPRSGLASKHGITLANAVGVVDSDYRGEWFVPLHNISREPFAVAHGMRVAQLVVTPVLFPEIGETDCVDETERGAGGFGSTGLGA